MKAKKNLYLSVIVMLVIVYIGLLTILYCSESANDQSMIRTFGDALWYSLVTLTTVGYGDLVPVTPLGHMDIAWGLALLYRQRRDAPFFALSAKEEKLVLFCGLWRRIKYPCGKYL